MLVLSEQQIAEIRQLVADYHTAFFINFFGAGDKVTEETRARLVSMGLIKEGTRLLSEDAVMFGLVLDKIQRSFEGAAREEQLKKIKAMTYQQFKKFVADQLPQPLTTTERAAVEHVRGTVYDYLKGMESKVATGTVDIIEGEDEKLREKLSSTVQRKLVEGIEVRRTIAQIGHELAKATENYAKDWYRVSATEVNNAYMEGKLQQIKARHRDVPDTDVFVYKRPSPGACPECVKAYLVDGKTPRVFSLSHMISLGNNVGKKHGDRGPVIGSLHPWCRCELYELLPGFGFDKDGNDTYVGVDG